MSSAKRSPVIMKRVASRKTVTASKQPHVPPPQSAKDLAVFEERLRSNLALFRHRKFKYRCIQFVLGLVSILGTVIIMLLEESRLLWIVLSNLSTLALIYIYFTKDYQQTMEQTQLFVPRVNRVLHHYNLAFHRPNHPPELSFSKRIPIDLVNKFVLVKREIHRQLLKQVNSQKNR